MNDLQIIKNRILEEDRIGELLDLMGCEHISEEQGGELVTAQLPPEFRSTNRRSTQVRRNEFLSSHIRSRGFKGDIFGLISHIVNKVPTDETQGDLYKAKEWVIEVLGYHDILDGRYNSKLNKKKSMNSWLKKIKKSRSKINLDDIKPNIPIDEKIRNTYIMKPYKGWIDEGISWETQMEFETGYDLWTDRIVNMVRDSEGRLIGVKGRYVGDNKDILDERKYLYLHKMNKGVELYNIHRALPYILKHKSVIVFEGYKSCMKAYDMGCKNTVSIEGDNITNVQVSLLKEIGLDIEIILAFDKDKMTIPKPEEGGEKDEYPPEIMEQANKITNRRVYAIIDKWDILGKKDSPTDHGKKVFSELLKRKVKLPVYNILNL